LGTKTLSDLILNSSLLFTGNLLENLHSDPPDCSFLYDTKEA